MEGMVKDLVKKQMEKVIKLEREAFFGRRRRSKCQSG
jgi:hypothetical protein